MMTEKTNVWPLAWEEVPAGICQVDWTTGGTCDKPASVSPGLQACEAHHEVFELGREADGRSLALEIFRGAPAHD
jgi:hypothetical protein